MNECLWTWRKRKRKKRKVWTNWISHSSLPWFLKGPCWSICCDKYPWCLKIKMKKKLLKRQSLCPAGLGGVPARSCCIIDYLSVPNSCVCIWEMLKVQPEEWRKSNKWPSAPTANRLPICCSSLCHSVFECGPFSHSPNFQSSSCVFTSIKY